MNLHFYQSPGNTGAVVLGSHSETYQVLQLGKLPIRITDKKGHALPWFS